VRTRPNRQGLTGGVSGKSQVVVVQLQDKKHMELNDYHHPNRERPGPA
jgi:hypothetical protein